LGRLLFYEASALPILECCSSIKKILTIYPFFYPFLDAGFTRAQVLEVVLGVGFKILSNYTNHLVETELDSAFQGCVWEPPT
jgi:hypothetical protein